ncbi:MAG: pilus assembly protein [Chloroflexi bacterium]|nr:pilus assembly protein [Chloroflexota bacterium]
MAGIRRRTQRGAALVEMALVLFLLVLLVMGIVDFGRAFNNYIIIQNASREGARYASRFPNNQASIVAATRAEAVNSGIPANMILVTVSGLGAAGGQPIRVTTTYNYATFLGGLIGIPNMTLSASTEMVVFGLD